MTPQYAFQVARWFASRWPRGPAVHIASTARHLPLSAPDDVRGMLWKGNVHLVAAQSLPSLAQTLAHEAVGHFGLRQLLGGEWRHFMRHLQDGARAGDPGLQELRSHIRRAYADEHGQYQLNAREEADELAAYVAEELVCMRTGAIRPARPWAQALEAMVGRALREGMCLDRPVSRSELEGTLYLAVKHLEGWPWHPIRQRVCRAWDACRTMLGMLDPYKPPMSLAESERLLKAEEERLKAKDEREGFLSVGLGIFGFIGLGVCSLVLAVLALARAFG